MINAELIEKVKENDFKAFHLLVQQYERLVFSIILKIVKKEEDAEDLAQEVFLQVFKKIKTYRAESSLSTWIGRIAYNHALNHIKKHNKIYVNNAEAEIEKHNTESSPEDEIIKEVKVVIFNNRLSHYLKSIELF